ncbi:MAG: phenol degradation protein meta, partial [Xanthobacteraceae bacterium]
MADEGGVSFWLPGIYGSLAAAPQQPGWSFAGVNYFDSVSASGSIAAAREVTVGRFNPAVNVNLNVNVNANLDLELLVPSYVFATPVFGGQLAVGVMGIVGRNTTGLNG